MQALISMINIFRALSIYFIFIPLYVIDADQTLADHVTHTHIYTHSFTDLIVTVVVYWQL